MSLRGYCAEAWVRGLEEAVDRCGAAECGWREDTAVVVGPAGNDGDVLVEFALGEQRRGRGG